MATTELANLAVAINDIKTIKDDIREIKSDFKDFKTTYVTHEEFTPIKDNYVRKEEFAPVRNLVYGFTAVILLAVIGALLAMVVNK